MKDLVLQLITLPASSMALENPPTPKDLVRYRKELIKVGSYVKASTGQTFEVTKDTLNHWWNTFRLWTENGNKVGIPPGHDKANDPTVNQGWVRNMWVEGNSLVGVMELLNPELALTTDVSIGVPAEFIDGKGKKYIQPITHVALCIDPVVPGLKEFEALSLSLSSDKGDNKMDLKKLAARLGVEEAALTEDAILAALDAAKPAAPITASIGVGTVKNVDPMLAGVVAENRTGKLDTLVRAGLLTPAIKDIIVKKYVETEALTLALSKGDDGSDFDLLVSILSENKPIPLNEQSGVQSLELSNPGLTKTNALAADVNRRRVAAGYAN